MIVDRLSHAIANVIIRAAVVFTRGEILDELVVVEGRKAVLVEVLEQIDVLGKRSL
jgi:hypothetical protein